jgi:hypothetical protein
MRLAQFHKVKETCIGCKIYQLMSTNVYIVQDHAHKGGETQRNTIPVFLVSNPAVSGYTPMASRMALMDCATSVARASTALTDDLIPSALLESSSSDDWVW